MSQIPAQAVALTNTVVDIGTVETVHGIRVTNPADSVIYVKFFQNAAAGVTLASDAPAFFVEIQSGASVPVHLYDARTGGLLSWAATTEAGAGATAPSAAVTATLFYD